MKKIITALLVLAIFACFAISAFAENGTSYGWYVKKNASGEPMIPTEQSFIENYDAFYRGDPDEKIIYLTFDAGYENGNVERILNVLKEKNVTAAFFLLDHIILKNTDLVKRMADEGHLVCNHTKNHKDLSKLSKDEIIDDLTDLERIYQQKCDREMAKYFRFPEGKYSEAALSAVQSLGYKTVFWSFGYADWDNNAQPDAKKAIDKIIGATHCGEVILLHPTSATNCEILPTLIDKWKEMGYSFGSLDQLAAKQ